MGGWVGGWGYLTGADIKVVSQLLASGEIGGGVHPGGETKEFPWKE